MNSLKASNRALEAMRNRQRVNPKEEAAALVRSQLEEWQREKERRGEDADDSTLAISTSCGHDHANGDVVPVSYRSTHSLPSDDGAHVATATGENGQGTDMDLEAMCKEAQKIEARIRHKRHKGKTKGRAIKAKGGKATTKRSPYE